MSSYFSVIRNRKTEANAAVPECTVCYRAYYILRDGFLTFYFRCVFTHIPLVITAEYGLGRVPMTTG